MITFHILLQLQEHRSTLKGRTSINQWGALAARGIFKWVGQTY